MRDERQVWIKRAVIAIFIIGSVWWGLFITSPPSPVPADAPAADFSAERAFQHVRAMAEEPHMLGSAEHDSMQQYILSQLEKLGLEPTVETGIVSRGTRHYRTQNIIARLEGTDPKKMLMLMSHYDTVPYSPGAADDAAGVATILETIRALKAGQSLKNDLLFLITDGEEFGLLGARQFAETNPLLNEVDLIINLEARGTSGSSILFETNNNNAKLIPVYAESTADPVANSLTYSIYKILPNDTDFSVFKPHGIQGMNFAFIEDYLNYHTMQDTPDNLSLSSLQHHGDNLLGNVQAFGNLNFDLTSSTDYTYFNGPFGGIIYYPAGWSYYLMLLTVLLFLVAIYMSYRRDWTSLEKSLLAFVAYILVLIIATLVSWFGWEIITRWIFPQYSWLQHGETYALGWYLLFFIGISALLTVFVFKWTVYKVNTNNVMTGIYLTCIILLIALSSFLPAANYLLLWPVFIGLIGWILTGNKLKKGILDWKTIGVLSVSIFPVLFLFPFYIELVQVSLTSSMLAASILLFLLMMGIAWPLVEYLLPADSRLFYYPATGFVVLCFAGAALNDNVSAGQKKQNSLIYATNQTAGESYWLTIDKETDRWTSQFLGENPADSSFSVFDAMRSRRLLYAEAPILEIHSPEVNIAADSSVNSNRYLTLQFRHTRPANWTTIRFPDYVEIREAYLDGKMIYGGNSLSEEDPDSFTELTYYRDMSTPFTLQLVIPAESPLPELTTVSYHTSLPDSLMGKYRLRADDMMPKPFGFTNGTVLKNTVRLGDL